jgi:hypothetical protein
MKTTEENLSYVKALYKPRHIYESRDKSLLPKFKDICCGFSSSYAIDIEGNAWAWGGGNLGFKDVHLELCRNLLNEAQSKLLKGLKTNSFLRYLPTKALSFCFVTSLLFILNLVWFLQVGKHSLLFLEMVLLTLDYRVQDLVSKMKK